MRAGMPEGITKQIREEIRKEIRGGIGRLKWLLPALLMLASGSAVAQMPDLKQMMGKPLPVADTPAGTVIVRVSNRLPMNGVAGVEVKATLVDAGGKRQMRTAKTADDGRATFEGLPQGSRFVAEATAEGETMKTSEFPVPSQGGVRVLLIAGLAAGVPPEAAGEGAAAEPGEPESNDRAAMAFDAMLGTTLPESSLPSGTLEIAVQATSGSPLAGLDVTLGQISDGGKLNARHATTDDKGVARFTGLPTGEKHGFIALAQIEGLRLAMQPFRMPDQMGLRGQLRALQATSDPSVLRVGDGSQFIFTARDEALVVWEAHGIRNTSDKLFVPGDAGGHFFPLPSGAQSTEVLRDSAPLEVLDGGKALRFTGKVPPGGPGVQPTEAIFAFGLISDGDTLTFRQTLPLGNERPMIVTPADGKLTVSGPGVRAQPPRENGAGFKIVVYELPPVPPGGVLQVTVTGIPAHGRGGQALTAALAVALVIGGLLFARQPRRAHDEAKIRHELITRREALFSELVEHERTRQPAAPPSWTQQRSDLVGRIETVYRDLASLDQRRQEGPA